MNIIKPINIESSPTVKTTPANFTKGIELCNRTACQTSHNVTHFNKTMNAWYCVKCARMINDAGRMINEENKWKNENVNLHKLNKLCVLDNDRVNYEKNFKKDGTTWAEYKQGAALFTF